MIKKLINLWQYYWHRRSGNTFLDHLRSKGVRVGKGTLAKAPLTINIDITRPELLEIGSNVLIHKYTTILTHDYASRVFVNLYGEFIPSHGKIKIGNNVWFGQHCTVLKGVTIGDNCIIGYGCTIMKDIPSNSVAVGTPAKVICTIEEYFNKRKQFYINELFEYAYELERRKGRELQPADFPDDYPAFVDSRNVQTYKFPYKVVFTDHMLFNKWLEVHRAPFNGFDEFMVAYKSYKLKYVTPPSQKVKAYYRTAA